MPPRAGRLRHGQDAQNWLIRAQMCRIPSQASCAPTRQALRPGVIAAKILTQRDGYGSELACSEPECLVGGNNRDSIQKRAPSFWAFYADMRNLNETTNETTQPYGPMIGFDVLPGQRWRRIGDSNF
jgi:hypothetical protein